MASSNNVKIDLHIHSNVSDGTLSPLEILHRAQQLDLAAIAITDHDSVDGAKAAVCSGIPPSLKFITGVEISANPPTMNGVMGSFHILGYGIDPDNTVLNQTLTVLQQARTDRNPKIIQCLNGMGFRISLSELTGRFGDGPLGRPHIAQLMIEKGYAATIDEVFDRYIGKGKPAYVDKFRVECDHAIGIINDAGGVPVLAHPGLLNLKNHAALESLLTTLKAMGLKGMEVYYPEHTPSTTRQYAALADKLDLLVTGGTDFHGDVKPEIQMGSGTGDLHVPYELFEKLTARLATVASHGKPWDHPRENRIG